MLLPEAFSHKTNRSYVYNISQIRNIPSIIPFGILSHDKASRYQHQSIAMDVIKERRENVTGKLQNLEDGFLRE